MSVSSPAGGSGSTFRRDGEDGDTDPMGLGGSRIDGESVSEKEKSSTGLNNSEEELADGCTDDDESGKMTCVESQSLWDSGDCGGVVSQSLSKTSNREG